MPTTSRQDKAFLLKAAHRVATELKTRVELTCLRIRQPSRIKATFTDGWAAIIGDIGKNRPRLEIWLDHFTGHEERKLWACVSGNRKQVTNLTERVAKTLVPHRVITKNETADDGFLYLSTPLRRDEFNVPILEKFAEGQTYFGVYERTKRDSKAISDRFLAEAVSFFEEIAQCLPRKRASTDTAELYPRYENRTKVVMHLRRERSRMLASAVKQRDDYTCQVCGLRFEDLYGEYGKGFAEAHHLVALSRLKGKVETKPEDMATVCANCHRMLHRMDGEPDDFKKLRAIVRRNQKLQDLS